MKNAKLLIWMTQLGISVAVPPACFIFLAVWLRNRFDFGQWIVWAGVVLGLISAIDGWRTSLKAMSKLSESKVEKNPPPVSFNDHE